MSEYRVCKLTTGQHEFIKKFDKKEDAEHYAKNASTSDDQHEFAVQKNHSGDFITIKSYSKGEEI